MMKILTTNFLVLIAFILLSPTSISAQQDFRKVNWGANSKTVMATETSTPILKEKLRIEYNCTLADLKGTIVYSFTKSDQLKRAKYHLTPVYYNMNYYIADYKMFENMLTKKYGKPAKRMVTTSTDKQTITEEDWPVLLLSGTLRVETVWSTPTTNIYLNMSKPGERPTLQLDYISIDYKDLDLIQRNQIVQKDI